ncbi:MAG TPA: kelch repeat-containing protein [Oligoflexus sp.]|uniref:Kelch repeat-containing protein n=1 Tax=Oligoflexus sp. TaxID=1971216 RepID=UPI002D80238E|nr:kelch repeat-containing protein [Oligoflexus sp.]HET9237360.1 kelch repeat-containing protein [Oligoflexus sp.]
MQNTTDRIGFLGLSLLVPFTLLVSSCQTVEDSWRKGPAWTFIPTPQGVGSLAHSLCGGSGGLFMAFGGIEEGRESPLNSSMIVYDSLQNLWQKADAQEGPPARNFASFTLMDQKAYVFGGETAQNAASADAYVYDASEGFWSSLPVPEPMIARKQATLTRVGAELVIFGGKGTEPVTNWARFRPGAARWQVHSYPEAISARVSHVAIGLDESRLLIWGGFEGKERRGDGFIFDLKTQAVTSLPAITPRANARALLLGDKVLVWGGAGPDGHMPDGALLNVKSLQWTPLPSIPDPRFQRLQGAEVVAQGTGSFLLFGGRFGLEAFNDQLWSYDIERSEWSLLRTKENPQGRIAHCFVNLEPRKYAVFGGLGYKRGTQSLTQWDGLWILDL